MDPHYYDPIYTYQSTIYLLALLFVLCYSVFYFLSGYMGPFYGSLLIMALFGLALCASRKGKYITAITVGLFTLILNTFIYVYFFGIQFGAHYFLLTANVLLSLNSSLKRRVSLSLTLSILAIYGCSFFLFGRGKGIYHLGAERIFLFREVNILLAFTLLALSFNRYSTALKQAENELKKYHGHIKQMAHTDALTNLPNRRSVEDELDLALMSSGTDENDKGLAIALGDLDDFKRINDSYGHNCGDEVLKEMASRFEGAIRNYDFLGRWGGEEFLFILRDTSPHQAYETMERLRIMTTAAPIECSSETVKVTVTFGVSHYRKGDTKESLFERADKLLYEGKGMGKNRVTFDYL